MYRTESARQGRDRDRQTDRRSMYLSESAARQGRDTDTQTDEQTNRQTDRQ